MAGYAAICGWLIGATLAANAPAPSEAPAAPSAELLLFLAEFGDADGRYVDPTTVDEADRDTGSVDETEPVDETEYDADDEYTDDPPPDRPR